MWNWYEYYTDNDGDTQYYTCKVCNEYPAMNLTFQDDNEYNNGPLCEFHWILEVNEKFHTLKKKLDSV